MSLDERIGGAVAKYHAVSHGGYLTAVKLAIDGLERVNKMEREDLYELLEEELDPQTVYVLTGHEEGLRTHEGAVDITVEDFSEEGAEILVEPEDTSRKPDQSDKEGGETQMTEYNSAEELVEAYESGEIESFAEYGEHAAELYAQGLDLDDQFVVLQGAVDMMDDETAAKIEHAEEVRDEAQDTRRAAAAFAGWLTRAQREAAEESERYQETIEELMDEYRENVQRWGGDLEHVNRILDGAQSALSSTTTALEEAGDEDARERFRERKQEHTDLRERMGLEQGYSEESDADPEPEDGEEGDTEE